VRHTSKTEMIVVNFSTGTSRFYHYPIILISISLWSSGNIILINHISCIQ